MCNVSQKVTKDFGDIFSNEFRASYGKFARKAQAKGCKLNFAAAGGEVAKSPKQGAVIGPTVISYMKLFKADDLDTMYTMCRRCEFSFDIL